MRMMEYIPDLEHRVVIELTLCRVHGNAEDDVAKDWELTQHKALQNPFLNWIVGLEKLLGRE